MAFLSSISIFGLALGVAALLISIALLSGLQGQLESGLQFHEEPSVPHFGEPHTGPVLAPNMVFTIEPMINAGGPEICVLEDKWTAAFCLTAVSVNQAEVAERGGVGMQRRVA